MGYPKIPLGWKLEDLNKYGHIWLVVSTPFFPFAMLCSLCSWASCNAVQCGPCHKWDLLGGFSPPLWKIWVRQLGWWHNPNINGKMPKMATKPPTRYGFKGVSSSSCGYPNSFVVFVRENPIDRNGWKLGLPPWRNGNLHMSFNASQHVFTEVRTVPPSALP